LVAGKSGAGKSSFLANSGANFEFVSRGDGLPRLFFAARAVYIDASGALASAPEERGAFRDLLPRRMFWRRRAFSGLLLVVDMPELLSMDAAAVSATAAELRSYADALALFTGYEVPAHIIFNKIDLLDGFGEFFGGGDAAGRVPFLGAVLDGAEPSPQAAFSRCHRRICGELFDYCVWRVINADNPGHYDRNVPLYRFLTGFMLAESQITAFLAEFFRPRGREGVRFRGFFFASSGAAKRGAAAPASRLSRKIVGDVIPEASTRVRELSEGTLPYYIRKAGAYTLIALVWAALAYVLFGGVLRDAAHVGALQSELAGILSGEATPASRFAALEKLRLSYEYLGGTLRRPGRLIFRTGGARAAVLRAYVAASERAVAERAARSVEASVKRLSAPRQGELSGPERQALYRELEAYLVLTGGNRVRGVSVDSIASRVASAFGKLPGVEGAVVRSNVYMAVKLAAGGNYKNIPADQNVVAAARERLAAAPQALTVYSSVMDRLTPSRRPLQFRQISGGGGMLRHGRDICDLYTRAGWENAVLPEFIKAARAPLKADWVTGHAAVAVNEERMLHELAALYADNLCRLWLDFVGNTSVNVPPNLPSLPGDLEALASRDSEVKRMLAAVCSLATQQPLDISLPRVSSKSASSIKGQASGAAGKLRGEAAVLRYDIPDPFAEARGVFAPLEAFLNGGAFDAYQGGLGKLAEKARQCGGRGSYAPFIARGADDPLAECRLSLNRACASVPAAVSAPLKRLLEPPLDAAAAALTKAITDEIEESWNLEVVGPYRSKLAGRYPIDRNGNDLAWGDFEEFFKPRSGAIWRYCDKNFSGIVERTSRGWEGAGRAIALPLSLNDEVLRCLNAAERITENFFKNDGAPKRHEIIFYPIKSSSGEAALILGDKRSDFKNGLPVTVSRPHGSDADGTITVRLATADKAQEEMRFTGEWAVIRLFEAGKVDRMGNDRYRVNWKLNVRGIYTANISAVAQSNTAALFDRGVTEGFAVPGPVFRNGRFSTPR
jgi:type VI protein secretion system component VasK